MIYDELTKEDKISPARNPLNKKTLDFSKAFVIRLGLEGEQLII